MIMAVPFFGLASILIWPVIMESTQSIHKVCPEC